MKALIELGNTDAQVTLKKGFGGVFEITIDGNLKFSKKESGRFPEDEEIHLLL